MSSNSSNNSSKTGSPEVAKKPKTLKDFKAPSFTQNEGLILYIHPYNFYSQKILFLLHEKNIEFTTYVIDLSNGEQYSKWFLEMNPKGDVPVLQDLTANYVVCDSINIINYVESKYTKDYPPMRPRKPNSKDFEAMQTFEKVLGNLPVGALSLGSFIHEDLKLLPKPPFVGPIRSACLKNNEKVYQLLQQSLETLESNKTQLLRKLDIQDRRKLLVASRVEFQKILDAVRNVLLYFEKELQQNPSQEWLVGANFSLADISFGLLLHRLYQLGFENYYWAYGKLPQVESYFLRFKARQSYQKLMPNNFEILKDIWQMTPTNYIVGAGAGVGLAVFAALAHK